MARTSSVKGSPSPAAEAFAFPLHQATFVRWDILIQFQLKKLVQILFEYLYELNFSNAQSINWSTTLSEKNPTD